MTPNRRIIHNRMLKWPEPFLVFIFVWFGVESTKSKNKLSCSQVCDSKPFTADTHHSQAWASVTVALTIEGLGKLGSCFSSFIKM